jgi:hypothetical protein
VRLDPEAQAFIQKAMSERGLTFKQALDEAIQAGLVPETPPAAFRTPTFRMGFNPEVLLHKALQLAAGLEDEELLRKHTADE